MHNLSIIFSTCKKSRSLARVATLFPEIRMNLSSCHSCSNWHAVIAPVTGAARGRPVRHHAFESTSEGVKMTSSSICEFPHGNCNLCNRNKMLWWRAFEGLGGDKADAGPAGADETHIGGKTSHFSKGHGGGGEFIVAGSRERGPRQIRVRVIPDTKVPTLRQFVGSSANADDTVLFTGKGPSCKGALHRQGRINRGAIRHLVELREEHLGAANQIRQVSTVGSGLRRVRRAGAVP